MPSDEYWKVKVQAACALARIAGDSPSCRDMMMAAEGLTAILALMRSDSFPCVEMGCWVIGELIREKPTLEGQYQVQFGAFILSFLSSADDVDIKEKLLLELVSITRNNALDIGLNNEICATLIQWIATST